MKMDDILRNYASSNEAELVDEDKLLKTMETSKKAFWENARNYSSDWFDFLYQQAGYIQKRWWMAQGLLLLLLWLVLHISESSHYEQRCMGIAASCFSIFLLPELWKNQNSASIEIEGTTYFALSKLYAARILLFGMADMCLLSVFFVSSSCVMGIGLETMLIQFFLPMNVTSIICFQGLCRKQNCNVFSVWISCGIWLVIWLFIIQKDGIFDRISTPVWMGCLICSVLFLGYSIYRVCRKQQLSCFA